MPATKPESLWKFGGLTPLSLTKRTWAEVNADDVWGHAAELSYYFLLALFPLLLFLISVLGFLAGPGSELRESLFAYLGQVMPGSAAVLVHQTMDEVHREAGGFKMIIGILAALWAASNGMTAITKTLNIAYDETETRSFLKKKATALGLTLGLSVLILSALTLVLFGGELAEWVAGKVGLGAALVWAWKILQWPLVLVFMFAAFAAVYYFAPNLEKPTWHWVSPGAALGLGLWLLASLAFRVYLQYFDSYSKTYGSLGAVIVLMLWFYITGLSILFGGELNAEIGHAADAKAEYEQQLEQLKVA